MNGYLRQSTASQVRTIGPFVDDTDFKTLETALTIANTDVKLKKNGATAVSKNSGGATTDSTTGLYNLTWDATDTNTVGELYVSVKVAGSLVYFCTYTVLTAAAYDATFASTATGYVTDQAVNVTKWAGTTTTTGDIAIKTTLAKTTHITGFNDVSTAQVNTEADTALADVGVTTTVTGRIDATVSSRATPAQVQTELGTYGALKPTVAARTLDVSTTGEAGLDWANVGGQGTTVGLTATTIATVTNATNVTNPVVLTSAYDAAKTASSQATQNTLATYVDTEVAAIKVVTDKLDTALVVDGAVYQYTANALELAPAGGGGGGDASQATLLAVKAKTDALPSDPADASDIAASFTTVNTKLDAISTDLPLDTTELNSIADALLKRDWTSVTGEAAYSALNAFRMLRNVWATSTGTLVVKKEDGSTTAWSRTLTTDPTAAPITGAT